MLSEMESPWAGDGRGLVTQRIFTKEGRLIATCVQEVSLSIIASSDNELTCHTGSGALEAKGEQAVMLGICQIWY